MKVDRRLGQVGVAAKLSSRSPRFVSSSLVYLQLLALLNHILTHVLSELGPCLQSRSHAGQRRGRLNELRRVAVRLGHFSKSLFRTELIYAVEPHLPVARPGLELLGDAGALVVGQLRLADGPLGD